MNPEKIRMKNNFEKTFELIEVTKDLSIARIMQDNPGASRKDAEAIFWKEVRRIKNLNSGIKDP